MKRQLDKETKGKREKCMNEDTIRQRAKETIRQRDQETNT